MSGLFERRTRPLATMDVRRLGPHQILGLETLLFFRLAQPVGATDTSIIFSLSKRYGADRTAGQAAAVGR